MTTHNTLTHDRTDILNFVREGMTVYDSEKNDIGTVESVHFGAASDANLATGTIPATTAADHAENDETFVDALAEVFDPKDEIPEEMADRLRYNGFIKIDGGWFGTDRYVMPNQISSVSDDGVHLSTKRERLIKE